MSQLGIILLFVCFVEYGLGEVEEEFSEHRFNEFDWGLTKVLERNATGNVVLSPISVKVALATLYEGSKGNTSRQLERALNFKESGRVYTTVKFASIMRSLQIPGDGYDLDIGTKVYVSNRANPNPAFKQKVEFLYNASVEKVDFRNSVEATKHINKWAESATHGRIKELVSESDTSDSTVMLLINAIFFKGKWLYPFPPSATAPGTFYTSPTTTITAQFMKAVNTLKYFNAPELKASILRLPYEGDKFAMYIILPNEKDGLQNVIKAITPMYFKALLPKLQEVTVQLSLPKFTFEYTASLAPVLQAMGLTDMFTSKADLTGIANNPYENLYVTNILQKAGLDVNEIGSTAYAATQVELVSKFGDDPVVYNANHPFIYLIEDEPTHTVVFIGKVVKPTSNDGPPVPESPKPAVAGVTDESKDSEQEKPVDEGETDSPLDNRFGGNDDVDRFTFFDIELLQRLHKEHAENTVISPGSIKTILGLILEGAEGDSARELMDVMRLPSNKTEAKKKLHDLQKNIENPVADVTLKIANRVLVNKNLNLKPAYKIAIGERYSAQASNADFGAPKAIANEINEWVSSLTQGFIPKLIEADQLDRSTQVVLFNAMYFKGEWESKFDPKLTSLECFYTSNNECEKTKMMRLESGFKYGYISALRAKLLEMPYNDGRYSMVFLLPDQNSGLDNLIRDLPFRHLLPILDRLSVLDVSVQIPRFTIDFNTDLVHILQKAGVREIFSQNADLSNMFTGKNKGMVSSILHRAKIEVNEKGTTAGAGTAAVVVTLMKPSKTREFIANRPFLFFIRDSKSGFLFEGKFVRPNDPSQSSSYSPTVSSPNIDESGGGGHKVYEGPKRGSAQSLAYPPPPPQHRPDNAQPRDKDALHFNK